MYVFSITIIISFLFTALVCTMTSFLLGTEAFGFNEKTIMMARDGDSQCFAGLAMPAHTLLLSILFFDRSLVEEVRVDGFNSWVLPF